MPDDLVIETEHLLLRKPTLEDKDEVLAMVNELNICGDEYPFEGASKLDMLLEQPYEDWLERCKDDETIENIKPNYSNASNYLLVDDNNHVYGYISVRHDISKGNLINIGGNIGYVIRPSERRKGYGAKQLNLALEKAKELGLSKVLITCRENNIGSIKTIQRCNGIEDTPADSKYPGIKELRFWIYLN